MNILCVDTSTNNCSIAVITRESVLGEIDINYDLQHSVLLMPLIESLLGHLKLTPQDLGALCLSKGPGSFTGLRIGMAAIKGMALALDLPVYAADSLEILASGAFNSRGVVVPVVDALRGGYYTGFYETKNGTVKTIMEPEVLTFPEIRDRLTAMELREVLLLGDLREDNINLLKEAGMDVTSAPPAMNIPKASNIGYLLLDRMERNDAEDVDTLVPLYMRKSQAEHEYEKKKGILND
ncbi:MAG TPA: tRNA (adenosine(37)-N6)-threonylcarbamoyltransferase complex dimerization subunit type 1 TsaB [Clostridiaceae bacterium]|nr:tRNA (adenosine(37)-N6)-threonylcarbamoyltransferase complex dimerization subunit type 1 TsaB [Clostridiaceae bacterium]